jgi:Helix-turn-helix domain
MTTELLSDARSGTTEGPEPLTVYWVEQEAQAQKAARSDDGNAVWVVRKSTLANRVVRGISWPSRKAGFLLLIGSPRAEVIPALERRFARVVFAADPGDFLPRHELEAVLKSPQRRDRFIGGMVDKQAQIVTLWRGDLTPFIVPFSAFAATSNGLAPDWDRFTVTDYGHTLRFGDYEAAADAVLYEYDPEFRRRLNKSRLATEQTLGASIRRLRKQRQLTRRNFPGLDPKTLARIERGEVTKPHADTLRTIARRLRVPPDELGSF